MKGGWSVDRYCKKKHTTLGVSRRGSLRSRGKTEEAADPRGKRTSNHTRSKSEKEGQRPGGGGGNGGGKHGHGRNSSCSVKSATKKRWGDSLPKSRDGWLWRHKPNLESQEISRRWHPLGELIAGKRARSRRTRLRRPF